MVVVIRRDVWECRWQCEQIKKTRRRCFVLVVGHLEEGIKWVVVVLASTEGPSSISSWRWIFPIVVSWILYQTQTARSIPVTFFASVRRYPHEYTYW